MCKPPSTLWICFPSCNEGKKQTTWSVQKIFIFALCVWWVKIKSLSVSGYSCTYANKTTKVHLKLIIQSFMFALVSAGIELIFFLSFPFLVGMVLCFGFGMRIMLATHWCLSCCIAVLAQSQGLFCCSCCPASEEAGRGRNQDRWPRLIKGMFHTMWCHAG